jgi:hypothetical protein
VAAIDGEGLRPDRPDPDAAGEPGGSRGDSEEARLLADGVDEQRLDRRQGRGKRDAGEAAAAPEIKERVDAVRLEDVAGGEAVGDVTDGDVGRIADGRQVDRLVPREEETDVAVDRRAGDGVEVDGETGQGRVEGVGIRGRKWRSVLDARRERFPRTAQALLRSVVPARAARAPLPASSFVTPCSIPVFPGSSGFWTGLPVPLASQVTQVVRCGCRTLGRAAGGVNPVIHESAGCR